MRTYISMTVIFSFEFMSLPRKADIFPMRFRMGPTTTNTQCGSVVVVLHLSAFSNASSRVASIRIKSFDVSGIGGCEPGGVLRRAYMEPKR